MDSPSIQEGIDHHAAIITAITDCPFGMNDVQRDMDQPFFFGHIIEGQGFFLSEFFLVMAFADLRLRPGVIDV